jgi:RNA polymerase sigma-70 factor (ECF subfamily)
MIWRASRIPIPTSNSCQGFAGLAHIQSMSDAFPPQRLSTDELFRGFAPFVARLLYHLGVAHSDIDDVLQEVFIVVHRLGGYVRGPATPTSYLASIAFKAASSARRRGTSQRARLSAQLPDELAAPNANPLQILERSFEQRQLEAALASLPPDARLLLVLVDLEGESCAAIAASERIPVGTVYWRLHRARRRFRDAVKRLAAGASAVRGRASSAEGRPL